MDTRSYLDYAQSDYIEELYEQYRKDPNAVDPSWQRFFEGMKLAAEKPDAVPGVEDEESHPGLVSDSKVLKENAVINLINAYRSRGHLLAEINPIRDRNDHGAALDIEDFGLSEEDLDTMFSAGEEIGQPQSTLREIVQKLKATYCGSIGVEYMHMRKQEQLTWLQERMERCSNTPKYDMTQKREILEDLIQAEAFEKFLQTKYMGQKRFSLEGGEVLIPALQAVIDQGAELGVRQFILGMAHRGRLNVLANILGKTLENIFSEFEDFERSRTETGGDVKYHKGYSTIRKSKEGEDLKLTLTFNPSHLEAVDPIVMGMAHAKAKTWFDNDFTKIAPILIHGDAAIAGQGIVYEVVQMSEVDGYSCGGTIHLVVNNQVGFTTNQWEARSTLYCTDIGKVTFSPVFHVNGNDPEAVAYVMQLATEFRQKFQRDVFVDILCFRKYGHNETDEPRFTQPGMYKVIDKAPSVREAYSRQLMVEAGYNSELATEMEMRFRDALQEKMEMAREESKSYEVKALQSRWAGFNFGTGEDFDITYDTAIPEVVLQEIGEAIYSVPEGFSPIKPVAKKLLPDRKKAIESGKINWATGELLAYGSLLLDGHHIRLSGQDCQRGTFSHRHAVIHDERTEEKYIALNNIKSEQTGQMEVYNSPLSEYGVLGFEYGHSLSTPNSLTIWEAQFGDFGNGAQIIIDQFISSAEIKWKLASGIAMLLPHGYEGMGPEHSSARLERFLQLAAQLNIQVVNCTTPANFFHVMRRQMVRNFRKPLIVMSPKGLLRHPKCVSPMEAFTEGSFQELIDDRRAKPSKVKKILFCSGKLFYELDERREALDRDDVAIVRVEQLYPLQHQKIRKILNRYKQCEHRYWVQEEPINMGAWDFMNRNFTEAKLEPIARHASASPADGSHNRHLKEQREIVDRCFED